MATADQQRPAADEPAAAANHEQDAAVAVAKRLAVVVPSNELAADELARGNHQQELHGHVPAAAWDGEFPVSKQRVSLDESNRRLDGRRQFDLQ